jgi:hypothetical protein
VSTMLSRAAFCEIDLSGQMKWLISLVDLLYDATLCTPYRYLVLHLACSRGSSCNESPVLLEGSSPDSVSDSNSKPIYISADNVLKLLLGLY